MTILVRTFDNSIRLLARIEKKQARVLVRTGLYGKRVMRNMIKRKTGPSAPGSPPHAHKAGNTAMRDTRFDVLGSFDIAASVIIGNEKYPAARQKHIGQVRSRKPVPQLLNEGGGATITERLGRADAFRIGFGPEDKPTVEVAANFRARPFRDKAERVTFIFFEKILEKERL